MTTDPDKTRIHSIKEEVQNEVGDDWSDDVWTDFVIEIVNLLHEKGKSNAMIVATAAGLMSYGIEDRQHLINVGDSKKELREALTPQGVPAAICDLLFNEYVKGSLQQQPPPGGKSVASLLISYVALSLTHTLC